MQGLGADNIADGIIEDIPELVNRNDLLPDVSFSSFLAEAKFQYDMIFGTSLPDFVNGKDTFLNASESEIKRQQDGMREEAEREIDIFFARWPDES